jgi:hypothetical protein
MTTTAKAGAATDQLRVVWTSLPASVFSKGSRRLEGVVGSPKVGPVVMVVPPV